VIPSPVKSKQALSYPTVQCKGELRRNGDNIEYGIITLKDLLKVSPGAATISSYSAASSSLRW